ncbi:hypothetical protein HBB16_20560 [Pseudonocardia sp. MCCB 268]|nr:hypothetical protein [Pseudonocardia cytotoxica]
MEPGERPDPAAVCRLLLLISVLLAAVELMFQMLYIGPVPVPVDRGRRRVAALAGASRRSPTS